MNEDTFDQIDAYLLGSLTPQEKASFEAEMLTDKALAGQVALQKLEHRAMQLSLRDDLKEKMSGWKKEREASSAPAAEAPRPEAKITPIYRRYSTWAAAAVLALAVVGARLLLFAPKSGSELAGEFYQPPGLTLLGESSDTSLFDQGVRLAGEQKYREAIGRFNLVQDSSLLVESIFIKAHCFYQLKEYARAADLYRSVAAQTRDPVRLQTAEWNFALMQIAVGDKNGDGKAALQKIAARQDHIYYQKAADLLKKWKG